MGLPGAVVRPGGRRPTGRTTTRARGRGSPRRSAIVEAFHGTRRSVRNGALLNAFLPCRVFDLRAICDSCAEALRERADALDEEQSPYGLDSLSELGFHPILHEGCRRAGFNVLPEQRYPTHATKSRRSEGDRCDIVLLESPATHLVDPLMAGTLFGARGARPDDALWIEVKIVPQFALVSGVACANQAYSSLLLQAASADVRKLAGDERIRHGAVMLVLLATSEDIIRHDVNAWACACLDAGLEIAAPIVRAFEIAERIGNKACAVAAVPITALQSH